MRVDLHDRFVWVMINTKLDLLFAVPETVPSTENCEQEKV